MGAHNHFQDGYIEHSRLDTKIADPGASGTFNLRGVNDGYAAIASGTRKLPDSVPLGVQFTVYATGSVTINTQAGVTVAILATGQFATFRPKSSTTWGAVVGTTGTDGAGGQLILDAGGYYTSSTTEGALQEAGARGTIINVPIANFYTLNTATMASAVPAAMAVFANNSAANPGFSLTNTYGLGIRFNNAATQDQPIAALAPSAPAGSTGVINVVASKTGATLADATTFDVHGYGIEPGSLQDTGTDYINSVTSAMTGNAAAKTVQRVTAAFSSDWAYTAGSSLLLTVKPTTNTLNTDDLVIHRVYITWLPI